MLKNLSIKAKLVLMTGLTVLFMLLMTVVIYTHLHSLDEQNANIVDNQEHAKIVVHTIQNGLQLVNAIRGVSVNPNDESAKKNYKSATTELQKYIDRLKTLKCKEG